MRAIWGAVEMNPVKHAEKLSLTTFLRESITNKTVDPTIEEELCSK